MAERIEFEAVSPEELYWKDGAEQALGRISGFQVFTAEDPGRGLVDESVEIDELCAQTKFLMGNDQARGFRNAADMMRWLAGNMELPAPIAPPPDEDGGTLACV